MFVLTNYFKDIELFFPVEHHVLDVKLIKNKENR